MGRGHSFRSAKSHFGSKLSHHTRPTAPPAKNEHWRRWHDVKKARLVFFVLITTCRKAWRAHFAPQKHIYVQNCRTLLSQRHQRPRTSTGNTCPMQENPTGVYSLDNDLLRAHFAAQKHIFVQKRRIERARTFFLYTRTKLQDAVVNYYECLDGPGFAPCRVDEKPNW